MAPRSACRYPDVPRGRGEGLGSADEALAGKWRGSRSSRLGDRWRVIYRVVPDRLTYYIESMTAHDYRRQ